MPEIEKRYAESQTFRKTADEKHCKKDDFCRLCFFKFKIDVKYRYGGIYQKNENGKNDCTETVSAREKNRNSFYRKSIRWSKRAFIKIIEEKCRICQKQRERHDKQHEKKYISGLDRHETMIIASQIIVKTSFCCSENNSVKKFVLTEDL